MHHPAVAALAISLAVMPACTHKQQKPEPKPSDELTVLGQVVITFSSKGEESSTNDGDHKWQRSAKVRYKIGTHQGWGTYLFEAGVELDYRDHSLKSRGPCFNHGPQESVSDIEIIAYGNAVTQGVISTADPENVWLSISGVLDSELSMVRVNLGQSTTKSIQCGEESEVTNDVLPFPLGVYGKFDVPRVSKTHYKAVVTKGAGLDHWPRWHHDPSSPGRAEIDLFVVPKSCEAKERTTQNLNESEEVVLTSSRYVANDPGLDSVWKIGHVVAQEDPLTAAYTEWDGGKIWTRIPKGAGSSLVQDAGLLAHERQHASDLHRIGVNLRDLAPLMSADEFAALTWEWEWRAFRFELTVLDEITAGKSNLDACYDMYKETDSLLRADSVTDQEREVSRRYAESYLRVYHEKFTSMSPGQKAREVVDTMRSSGELEKTLKRWKPYIH
jgi:hypothetical protein